MIKVHTSVINSKAIINSKVNIKKESNDDMPALESLSVIIHSLICFFFVFVITLLSLNCLCMYIAKSFICIMKNISSNVDKEAKDKEAEDNVEDEDDEERISSSGKKKKSSSSSKRRSSSILLKKEEDENIKDVLVQTLIRLSNQPTHNEIREIDLPSLVIPEDIDDIINSFKIVNIKYTTLGNDIIHTCQC